MNKWTNKSDSTEAKSKWSARQGPLTCNSAVHLSIGSDHLSTGDGMRLPSLALSRLQCQVAFVERRDELIHHQDQEWPSVASMQLGAVFT